MGQAGTADNWLFISGINVGSGMALMFPSGLSFIQTRF